MKEAPMLQRLLGPTRSADLQHLVKKAAQVFMSNWLKQLAAFCLSVFVARSYGAEGRGIYALLTAGASLLGVILSLGLNNAVIYYIKNGRISALRGLEIILANSLIVAGIAALFLNALKDQVWALLFESVPFSYLYLLFVAAYSPVLLLTLYLVSYYLATHQIMKHRMLIGTTPFVTLMVAMLIGVVVSGVDAALLALLLVEGCYVAFFSLDVCRCNKTTSATRLPMAEVYSFALHGYTGSLGSTVLTQVDTMVVAAFNSPKLLGYYAVSKSLYRVVLSIPQAFNGLLFGTYCDIGAERSRVMNLKVIRLMTLVLVVCMVPALLLGGPAVLLVYGQEFARSIPALNILLFAAFFMGVSSSSIPFFLACGRPGLISNISLVSGIVSVSMTVLLVPHFSIEGAAAATLVGALCFVTLRLYYGRKIYLDAPRAENKDVECLRQEGSV